VVNHFVNGAAVGGRVFEPGLGVVDAVHFSADVALLVSQLGLILRFLMQAIEHSRIEIELAVRTLGALCSAKGGRERPGRARLARVGVAVVVKPRGAWDTAGAALSTRKKAIRAG
jgi:hypothetical protein